MATIAFDAADLPADHTTGLFLGRIATPEGPSPILVERGIAFDMTPIAPTAAAGRATAVRRDGRAGDRTGRWSRERQFGEGQKIRSLHGVNEVGNVA